MIAQFNALLIMALHHGQQDPTIAHFILKVSRLLVHVHRTHMLLCMDRKHQCVTLGFLCAKIGTNIVWQ
jgi:hypothetical protein